MTLGDPDIRLAPLADVDRFLPLMQVAFELPVARRHFAWKYRENPAGQAVAFEAVGERGPVALYAAVPEIYQVGGRRTRVYQPVDVMTHPEYRGKSLYPELARRAYEHILATEGRCTMLAFPSAKVAAIATSRLGWTRHRTIPLVFLPRIVRRMTPRRSSHDAIRFTAAESAADLAPYLERRSPPADLASPELSPEFLQWRGFDHPYNPARACLAWSGSRAVGMCLFSVEPGRRCLTRLAEFTGPNAYRDLIAPLVDHLFERTGATVVYTWEPADSGRRTALRRAGFVKNPSRWGPGSSRQHFIVRSLPAEVNGRAWSDWGFDLQPILHD